jgi:hypothetical protein
MHGWIKPSSHLLNLWSNNLSKPLAPHYEKNGCFVIGLATQFLSCIKQLQCIIFICCECYQTSCKSYKSYNSPYIWCNSLQLDYNFIATTFFQLPCNSLMTTFIMSCWHHFSSIHQILTCGIMRIFCNFFEILISIVHYNYSFFKVLDYDMWHNQKLPHGILNWILETNTYMYLGKSIHSHK